ncbi:hypothetical protein FA09DRAFT_359532 [Tilletiopsis washingtonensis]|uniref:Uncharacterized protein n=1 Tax=Tilletiopsis washingtonensis TaxID=58919 RepID=A0A316ZDB4_9BASI|nr:hypothetical protein FA09DRAFT_359532 [Tilletiopsis washingtonensis]PWN99521.1 hypothetical protein FA09DRAFT_359532 [Tilletiopsis washingtonensis]
MFALLASLLLASQAHAQLVGGSGPSAPVLSATAATGSWAPAATAASPKPALDGTGRQLYINSANDFCLLMPPDPTTQNLVDAEADAVAYCINPMNGTRPMPDGFIVSAHFKKAAGYKQIIGQYNPAVMNLGSGASPDCGGEYDSYGAQGVGNPVGAAVTGAVDYQQFLGGCDIPGKYTFALRACTDENTHGALCDHTYDLMGMLYTQPSNYEDAGFDDCEVTDTTPLSVLPNGSTFRQGDSTTPLPSAYRQAPSSSNCVAKQSPAPSGVTYTWNQAAAQQTTGASSSSRGGSSGSSSRPAATSSGSSGSTGGAAAGAVPAAGLALGACAAAAMMGAMLL